MNPYIHRKNHIYISIYIYISKWLYDPYIIHVNNRMETPCSIAASFSCQGAVGRFRSLMTKDHGSPPRWCEWLLRKGRKASGNSDGSIKYGIECEYIYMYVYIYIYMCTVYRCNNIYVYIYTHANIHKYDMCPCPRPDLILLDCR